MHVGAISDVLNEIFDDKLRNAFYHSDYILHNGKLRLKHKVREYKEIDLDAIFIIINKILLFYNIFKKVLFEKKREFEDGQKLTERKSKSGVNLCDIVLSVDPAYGVCGISTDSPLPMWGND